MIDLPGLRKRDRPPEESWRKPPVIESADLKRVLALPRRTPNVDLSEAVTEQLTLGPRRCECQDRCITTLRPVQSQALYEIAERQGFLGPIRVGDGKTLIDILAPLALGRPTSLLLVPAKLVDQLVREYFKVREHFKVPELFVHGKDLRARSDQSIVLHVISYERLSRSDATAFLESLGPDAIIADECHHLRNATAVRTGRVLRYFAAHPETRFCGHSGSLTDASIKDYAHLSALALREGSPLPLDPQVVEDWSRALDASDDPAPPGALTRLCQGEEDIRRAFHRRLVETAGVVASSKPTVEVALTLAERPAPPIPQVVREALANLRATWTRPDGEELVDSLSFFRCARELACGFFYRWVFRHGETPDEIDEWLAARKAWRREQRRMLEDPQPHLDSPQLLERAAERGQRAVDEGRAPKGRQLWWAPIDPGGEALPHWRSETWPRWRDARPLVAGGGLPDTEPVRLDPYLAEDAAAWAREHRGIVWYDKHAFGVWVAQIAELPLHGGGPQAGERICAEKGDRSIVASIKSHGEGRDGLQHLYSEQLVAHPPAGSAKWEQLLGRLHRVGQAAERVSTWFYAHTEELSRNLEQAVARAEYVRDTLGADQKILTAR